MHGLIFETSIWLLAGSTRLDSPNASEQLVEPQPPEGGAARIVNDTGLQEERNESRKTEREATEIRYQVPVVCSTWNATYSNGYLRQRV